MIRSDKIAGERRLFAFFFVLISVFALIGSLYSWGSGFLFHRQRNHEILLPIVDLLFTFPLSLTAGYLLFKDHPIGYILGLLLSGCLIYGSIAVYVELFLIASYPWYLVVPPITGIALSIVYTRWYYTLYKYKLV